MIVTLTFCFFSISLFPKFESKLLFSDVKFTNRRNILLFSFSHPASKDKKHDTELAELLLCIDKYTCRFVTFDMFSYRVLVLWVKTLRNILLQMFKAKNNKLFSGICWRCYINDCRFLLCNWELLVKSLETADLHLAYPRRTAKLNISKRFPSCAP